MPFYHSQGRYQYAQGSTGMDVVEMETDEAVDCSSEINVGIMEGQKEVN